MKILLTGPQGSGKTTQAESLARYLNVPLVGTGEVLRQMAKGKNTLGEKIRKALDKGYLVDDKIVAQLVVARLSRKDCKVGFVMDGYPRSRAQLRLFDPRFDKVFYLDLSDDEVTGRLLKRGREDDIGELIEKRLKVYHEMTEPLLEYYQEKSMLVRINGLGTIDEVQSRIRQEING